MAESRWRPSLLTLLLAPALRVVSCLSFGPAEVVGAAGRVGSALASDDAAMACIARADFQSSLGLQSPPGSPIIVATGAEAWDDVVRVARRRGRVSDLVFVGNGPLEWIPDESTAVLLYARAREGRLEAPAPAPPCRAFGKHAEWCTRLLEARGVACSVVRDREEFEHFYAAKLSWACTMWLACAELGTSCDRIARHDIVHKLVRELAPWISSRADVDFIMEDQAAYAQALEGCVPSASLALSELDARNGWCLKRAQAELGSPSAVRLAMPLHTRLLEAHTNRPLFVGRYSCVEE
mmetsp:Transcript_5281/g.14488  ORF Transcript_5281/g.14488 Transcript_5281/m.14488 type:complete len:295 (+) Transcript_5281:293-1177(+)